MMRDKSREQKLFNTKIPTDFPSTEFMNQNHRKKMKLPTKKMKWTIWMIQRGSEINQKSLHFWTIC